MAENPTLKTLKNKKQKTKNPKHKIKKSFSTIRGKGQNVCMCSLYMLPDFS